MDGEDDRTQDARLPCADKLAFDTRRQAEASATVARYRYGGAYHVYRCRHCQLWHLASGPAGD